MDIKIKTNDTIISDLAALVKPVYSIVKISSRLVMDIYTRNNIKILSGRNKLVTNADLLSNYCISHGLKALTPKIPILSEETDDFAERKQSKWIWIIDPLDGTNNFVRHNNQFSINVGLVMWNRPVFGLVLFPTSNVYYYAWSRGGAFKKQPNIPYKRISIRAAHNPIRLASSKYSHKNEKLNIYKKYIKKYKCITLGSAALKFCLLAEGKIDIYPRFGPTGEWDTAACQVILEQAGGYVTDMKKNPLIYNKNIPLNPDFIAYGDSTIAWYPK